MEPEGPGAGRGLAKGRGRGQSGHPFLPWRPIFWQLLWDLELLTGAGLSLFWPPWPQFCGLRGQARCVWSQRSKPHGGTGGDPERWASRVSRGLAGGGGVVSVTLG